MRELLCDFSFFFLTPNRSHFSLRHTQQWSSWDTKEIYALRQPAHCPAHSRIWENWRKKGTEAIYFHFILKVFFSAPSTAQSTDSAWIFEYRYPERQRQRHRLFVSLFERSCSHMTCRWTGISRWTLHVRRAGAISTFDYSQLETTFYIPQTELLKR